MNWLAIINEIFDIGWLIAVLILLFLIWRSSERRHDHAQKMEQTIVEIGMKDAESARQAVEAARTLAAVVQNEQAKMK